MEIVGKTNSFWEFCREVGWRRILMKKNFYYFVLLIESACMCLQVCEWGKGAERKREERENLK